MLSVHISNLLRGQGTLHGQVLARLLLVLLFAAVAIMLIAGNNYYVQHDREIRQKRVIVQQYYERELPLIEQRWQAEAAQMKARIEISRLLEEREEVRWAKLNSILNAQSEFLNFSNILFVRGGENVLFRYGPDAQRMQITPGLLVAAWHYDEGAQILYRVFRFKMRLGGGNDATLLLLKTVNNSAMKTVAAPETLLHLYFHDQVLASSNGADRYTIRPGVKDVYDSAGMLLIQADLAWPGSGEQPTLIMQREYHEAYPLREFLLRPLAVMLTFAVLIWFGLGRWLTRTVNRIENIEAATLEYDAFGITPRCGEQLEKAKKQPDEISDLAAAMGMLMQNIEASLVEQRAYLDTLAMLEEAVLEIDCNGVIQRASPGWNKLSHTDSAIGKPLFDFVHSDDRELLHAQCAALVSGEKNYTTQRLRLDTGKSTHYPWMECRLVAFRDEYEKIAGIRGVIRDITQTYLHEKQITYMGLHDALTGLPNRILLEDRFKVSIRLASRTVKKVAVCFIDLDHFKNVNDTLGHTSGDKLLLAFAERLRWQLREGDTVARWGGDEFVLLLPDMESEQDIRDIVGKLSEDVQKPLQIEGAEIVVTFSMGVSFYPDDGEDIATLFSQADRAMFFAKAQGRNQACFFCDMSSSAIDKNRLYIQNRLANAINADQIQTWFQPIISADSGLCTSVEVLARWYDEEYGWISPSTFIPMAENLGLIRELGQQVLLASLAALQRWQQAGLQLTMAINISKRQLFKPYFTERLLEEVERHQVFPHSITLEVTESVAMLDVDHAVDRLHEIRQAGFRIALDDFGTGYSSLSQLHEMHVDKLKIDISFIRRLHEKSGLTMTQTIINLANSLKMEIVAEGVETEEVSIKLREMGVNYLQGFYFAKAMPLEEFEQWLAKFNNKII